MFTILLYALALAAAMLAVDRLLFQNEKKLETRGFQDIFPTLSPQLPKDNALRYLQAPPGLAREDIAKELQEEFDKLSGADWAIFRVRLVDNNSQPLVSPTNEEETRARKMRQYNSFRNCLIIRRFEDSVLLSVGASAKPDNGQPLGWIEVTWTTPPNVHDIELLTKRYRAIAAAVGMTITLVFASFFRLIILPVRRVSGAIENSLRLEPALLRRPGSNLERAYNNLARDALISRLQGQSRERITQQRWRDIPELMDELAGLIQSLFRLPLVCIVQQRTAGAAEADPRHWTKTAPSAKMPDAAEIGPVISALSGTPRAQSEIIGPHGTLHYIAQTVPSIDDEQVSLTLVVGCEPQTLATQGEWLRQTVERLSGEVSRAIGLLRLHQASVFRQRSEASINLAENLGHDLTNIIAGARLDLATLRKILEKDVSEFVESPKLRDTMKEAIQHLIANTRFLQEIVNIYRAFTNLKRPRYESVDLNGLVREIGGVFQNSISAQIDIEVEADPEVPSCVAEPRLIKLALFNLLTNASDAIKATQAEGGVAGRIRLSIRRDPDSDRIWIAVRDDGRGILNENGHLAAPNEIERIFGLGYSTKKDEISEGLGLSWVRSIVTEFHRGRLEAENLPEKGAEFRIALPLDPENDKSPPPAEQKVTRI